MFRLRRGEATPAGLPVIRLQPDNTWVCVYLAVPARVSERARASSSPTAVGPRRAADDISAPPEIPPLRKIVDIHLDKHGCVCGAVAINTSECVCVCVCISAEHLIL